MTPSSVSQIIEAMCKLVVGLADPNPVACGDLLAECWGKILELVQSYDLDLTPAS